MKKWFPVLVGLAIAPSGALAKDLPVTIRVSGEAPQAVMFIDGAGTRPLAPDPTGKLYSGSLSVDSDVPKTFPIAIRYQRFRYPLGIRLHRNMRAVQFEIALAPVASCTDPKIDKLEEQSGDFEEALAKSLQARQILAIDGNDRCRSDLRARAARAAYRNTVRASDLSSGLIAVNEDFATEYASIVPTSSVRSEIAEYRDRQLRSEAIQLVADRLAAQKDHDFETAFAIQTTINERIRSDSDVTVAYAAEGITADRAEKDSAYLGAMADARAERQAERPQP